MPVKTLILAAMIAVTVTGCFEGKSYITSDKSNKVSKYLMDSPPKKMDATLNLSFGNKLILLGYDLDRKDARSGDTVTVTWYWKCLKSPGPGWRLMTHIFDREGTTRMNADSRGPIREHFQPEHWRPGLIVKDVQKLEVPKNWKSSVFELRAGLWKGAKRLSAKGELADKGGRARGPKITIMPSEISRKTRRVMKAEVPPKIDGKIDDDPAWKNVGSLETFLDTMTGLDVPSSTDVKILWDDKNIYIAVKATDNWLLSEYQKHDDPLWKQDAFEIFLDPGGDSKNYYELQFNPAGIIFDSKLPSHRKNQNEWSSNMVVKTIMTGTLNDDKNDTGWTAEARIPFASLMPEESVPPTTNTMWTANFFRVDKGEKETRYSAWSPPLRGDFHALDQFAKVLFVDKMEAPLPMPSGRGFSAARDRAEGTRTALQPK